MHHTRYEYYEMLVPFHKDPPLCPQVEDSKMRGQNLSKPVAQNQVNEREKTLSWVGTHHVCLSRTPLQDIGCSEISMHNICFMHFGNDGSSLVCDFQRFRRITATYVRSKYSISIIKSIVKWTFRMFIAEEFFECTSRYKFKIYPSIVLVYKVNGGRGYPVLLALH